MTDFSNIEREYLKIESLDHVSLGKLHLKHKEYFDSPDKSNLDQLTKTVKILTDIACSYSFAGRHAEFLSIHAQINSLVSSDIASETANDINHLHFCAGQSYLALRNFRKALIHFKAYRPAAEDKEKIELLKQLCKDNIRNQILKVLAAFGLTILVVKYTTRYVFTNFQSDLIDDLGWLGALCMLAYGIFTQTTERGNKA